MRIMQMESVERRKAETEMFSTVHQFEPMASLKLQGQHFTNRMR